jgi:D-alanyl-D-alanine carboxypeptidase
MNILMNRVLSTAKRALVLAGAISLLYGCGNLQTQSVTPPPVTPPVIEATPPSPLPVPDKPGDTPGKPGGTGSDGSKTGGGGTVIVTAKPTDMTVLVNTKIMLPANYKPADLVEPNVPFIFAEKSEKRLMRKEAAQALERMFAGAKQDGIHLAGVSGYRSYETQQSLFNYYVKVQGEEVARKYSAEPGHSEHQTGLAMDVSGTSGKCAADDCFADTVEAKWLAQHAPEYGFIVRYPKGKEAITGYNYEPWHVRYLGTTMSKDIAAKGVTLEEYLHFAV